MPTPGDPAPTADRPELPSSYGLLSAQAGRGLLDWQHADARLGAARNYWVITASGDGKPHAAPVWGVWLGRRFYFGTDLASRKARNLASNASVVLHLESGDEVVIVEGQAELAAAADVPKDVFAAYQTKYGLGLEGNPVFVVLPRLVFAWSEADFPGSATRWSL
jgi:hypothetical protein